MAGVQTGLGALVESPQSSESQTACEADRVGFRESSVGDSDLCH